MALSLYVSVSRDGESQAEHVFSSDDQRTVKIGRLPKAQLRLEDPSVARIHAVIDFSASVATITDMGSTGGTLVNGEKVHKAKLSHGDKVNIGETVLHIGVDKRVEAAPKPAAAAAPNTGALPTPVAASAPEVGPGMPQPAPGTPQPDPAPTGGPPAAHPPAQAFALKSPVAPMPAAHQPPAAGQPNFDGDGRRGLRRISTGHLTGAAVESRPHPSLPPEPRMTNDSRVLEMRVYWGEALLAVHHYDKPKKITIGEAKGTDFFISSEGLPAEVFPMIRYIDNEYVLTYTSEMEGELEVGGVLNNLSTLRSSSLARRDDVLESSVQIRLPSDSRGIVHWGGATFALRFVAPTKPPVSSFFQNLDLHYINLLVASLFLHFVLVTVMVLHPYETSALRVDLFDEETGIIEALVLEEPKRNKKTVERLKQLTESIAKRKAQHTPKADSPTPTKIKAPTRAPSAQENRAQVASRFKKMFSGGSANLLGGSGAGSLAGTVSNVIGTAGKGLGALAGTGIRGTGALTGGNGGASRGIGGVGTAGRHGGGGPNYGGGVGLGGRSSRGLVSLETPRVVGALPREVIQRVINQHKQQIRYCYEQQLQRNQNLKGRIEMKWVIAATGRVATVKVNETSMNSRPVERCIAAKIKTWKFPPPAGGGVVEVNYPFVFRSSS